ncbi:MAG: ligand-binding sensor domain-containing protein [Planctomycetota bacterium]
MLTNQLNRYLSSAILLLLCALPVAAHNGQVALAYPVENIALDGDLSDWPADFVSYPIDTPRGGSLPLDANDFEGSFRIGYNLEENALYLAVKMRDESMVLDGEDFVNLVFPTNRDACTPIINLDQEKFKSAVVFQPTWPVVVGNERHAMTAGTEVAFARDETAHYYEWRINAGQTETPVVLNPGRVIGLMIGLWDRDADGSSTLMAWGQGHFNAPAGLSDVVLVRGETAHLKGTVQWPDQSRAGYVRVRIHSLQNPQTWVQVETNAQGSFSVELPADAYRIEALGQHVEVTLQPNTSEHTTLIGQFPQGQELEVVQRVKKATVDPRQGSWQTFGLAQGLDAREMYAMHHDRQDRMWFGALNDLIRYDGREFVHFATAEGPINFLTTGFGEDRRGHLWFGSYQGVFRYDGEHIVQFTTQDGLLDDVVYAIHEDSEGYLWFGSEGGVSRYDGERFVHFTYREGLVEGIVPRIAEDAQGRLYFSGFRGFSRYDGETFENFDPGDPDIHSTFALHIDRHGHLWTTWAQGGITRFDGETFEHIRTINGGDITRGWMTSIAEDHRGDLWFSKLGKGIFRYDGEEWQHYGAGDALGTGMVFSIYKDRHEGLWMTAGGGVLVRYDDYQFNNLTTDDGLSNNQIMTVVEDEKGHLWLGTKRDINHYDGVTFTQVADSVSHHYWRSRKDSRGHLWFTSSDGVHRYDGTAWHMFTAADGLAGTGTKGIVEDGEGHIWVADPNLSRYDGKSWTSFTVADGLASHSTGDLAVDNQGDLWIGRTGGVDRFDGEQFTHFDLGEEFIFRHWGDVHRGRDGTM